MKLIALILLVLFVAGTFGAELPSSKDVTSELPPPKEFEKKTTTKPTTTTVETSTVSTTTEMPKPTPSTTSEAPSSTKAPDTSSKAPVTSTTQVPVTTSSEAPKPTTPKPKPSDKPEKGKWSLSDPNTKETCIIVQMAAQLNFTYTTSDNKQNKTVYNIPVGVTNIPQGNCANGTDDARIIVSWPAQTQNKTNTFAYTFGLKDDKKTYYLKEAAYAIFDGDFYNGTNNTLELIHNGTEYATLKGYSYHCTREQQLNLTDTKTNKTVGSVHVSQVQLQAFYSSKSSEFASAIDCDSTGTPDYVPIAVGISLIALVVIVLIGYLVGRRRAQANGYVSM